MRSAVPLAAFLLLGLVGCSGGDPSEPITRLLAPRSADLETGVVELLEPLARGRWEREGELWWATSRLAEQGAVLPEGATPRLRGAGTPEVGVAARDGNRIAWSGAGAPELELVWPTALGRRAMDGAGGDRWRVEVGGLATFGFALRSGAPAVRVPAVAGSELRAAVSCLALGGPLRLTVTAAGRELGSFDFAAEGPGRGALSLQVPPDPTGTVELELGVSGSAGVLFLHAPRTVPRDVRVDERPDILVFLADTFRADNLSAYGGVHGVTPALDAFAEKAVVFERAWSPAAWTLPSHASLFTGLYPHEHGAVAFDRRPNERLATVAGRLAAAGYRTSAITDGHFVSRNFGLDAGFEWFEEMPTVELYKTLLAALERVDDDDGRPHFLFVQTYRVHGPYAPSDRAREEHGERLGLVDAAQLQERIYRELIERQETGGTDGESLRARMAAGDWHAVVGSTRAARELRGERAAAQALHRLYLGGVADLDREVGVFLEELERRSFHDNGAVVFTSDHGEAFDEHGLLFHARGTWDEVLRIPLIVRAPDLRPGRVSAAATLVDLAPTLTALAGIGAEPIWRGRDLLSTGTAPVFAFDCAQGGEAGGALVDGSWKLAFAADQEGRRGETRSLFDLASDPRELEDLREQQAARVVELLDRFGARLEELIVEPFASISARLDEAERRRLEAMGYVDE